MTDFDASQRLSELRSIFSDGRYWNHDPSVENDPASVRDIACSHHPVNSYCNVNDFGACGCNCFDGKIQCAGFAYYMAYRVFGTYPTASTKYANYNGYTDNNGWIYYTNENAAGISLAPGDIIRKNGHSAIVHTVTRNSETGSATVNVAEVWGGINCEINWGSFNDGVINGVTNESSLTAAGSGLEYIIKAPKSNDTVRYTVRLYRNYSDSDTEQVNTMYLEAGKTYSENGITLPILSRENYLFAGWFTDPVGGTQHTANTTVPAVDYPLYAQWIPLRTVRFYRNYSDSDTVQLDIKYLEAGKTYSENGVTLYTPPREDYRFDGWFTDRVGGTQHTLDTIVHGYDYDLYAHWTRVYVNISYYRNHSDSDTTVYVKKHNADTVYGDSLLDLSSLDGWARDNYKFAGWYTDREGGTQHTADSIIKTYDHPLFARWKRVGTIHYMRNYTVNDDKDISRIGVEDEPLNARPMPHYDDYETDDAYYTFDGWYTSRSGGIRYTESSIFPNVADLYLYAHWQCCAKVYYMRNQSDNDETCDSYLQPQGQTFISQCTFDDYETTDAYYKFAGWYSAKVGGILYEDEEITVPLQKELYLYAHWVRYTRVAFNEILYARQPYTRDYPTGLPFGSLSSPHETGYRFDGWFSSWDGGTKYTAQTIVPNMKNMTMYAHWSQIITVYLHDNYSDASPLFIPCYANEPYGDYLDSYHPSREGCEFKGWYTSPDYDDGDLITSSSIIPEDSSLTIHLYAHWTVDVVYNPCGGCMLGKSVYTYDVGALFWKLPEVCCCEEEKYFDGWYTLPNGYGEKISMITAVPDHSITLYANWRPEL